ncbi:MAG: twin-arginine translocation signal domain-containing protein [Sphingobacteriales bacterium]|nr:MAG: twin-arginine translocation signal domain-containing protein [Sphingobacteriales bacterium]
MSENNEKDSSRRNFLKNSVKGAALGAVALTGFPTIVPASVLGKNAPSNRINIGMIGMGRIGHLSELSSLIGRDNVSIVAVCDVDSIRVTGGQKVVNDHYARKTGKAYDGTKGYGDYREMLQNKDIDAVTISTPDHWHSVIGIDAVRAGKDVYLQKPTSLTIADGRALSNEVHKTGRILQVGSQQRSSAQFKKGCELVRNGRIGKVHTVYVGLPIDDPKQAQPEPIMPVPENLNYDMWLGPTPYVPYTERRVHSQKGINAERPGWLRCEQYGAGMITGWGAHHFDIVNWGLGTEYTGPVEISAKAVFPDPKALWDVHGSFKSETIFANGVKVIASDSFSNGIRFEGSEGWIFVSRGDAMATPTDPVAKGRKLLALDASDPKILSSEIGPDEIHLYNSTDHHGDWLQSIISRKEPIAPIEVGHRACSVCMLNHIAMKLNRKLYWDPIRERFKNDDEANFMLSREQRWPYQMNAGYNLVTLP